VEAIRIVSLPAELKTTYDVADFIIYTMPIGLVSYVVILEGRTDAGVPYRSAIAEVGKWLDTDNVYQDIVNGVLIPSAKISRGIHFDNGKPMDYVKVVAAKSPAPSLETLVLPEGAWTNLFLPVVPQDLSMDRGDVRLNDEDVLADFFECCLRVGKVSHVEFTKIPGKPYRSAIVYFSCWYDNQLAKTHRRFIETKGEFVCKGFYDGFEHCRFDNGRFISLKEHKQSVDQKKKLTLKEAYDQLLSVIKESEEYDDKLIEEFGTLMTAFRTPGVSERPGFARLHYDDEYDVIYRIYERIPIAFRDY
jgi:hypothetical protein